MTHDAPVTLVLLLFCLLSPVCRPLLNSRCLHGLIPLPKMLFSSPFAWRIPKHHYLISYYPGFLLPSSVLTYFSVYLCFFVVCLHQQNLSSMGADVVLDFTASLPHAQYMPIFPKWRSEHFDPFSKLLKIINVNQCYYRAFLWPTVKSHILILVLTASFASFIQNTCIEHLLPSRHYSRTKRLSSFVFLSLGAKSSAIQNILSTLATRVLATTNRILFFPCFCSNCLYCL